MKFREGLIIDGTDRHCFLAASTVMCRRSYVGTGTKEEAKSVSGSTL
jgi:hypothetical protein